MLLFIEHITVSLTEIAQRLRASQAKPHSTFFSWSVLDVRSEPQQLGTAAVIVYFAACPISELEGSNS